MFQPTTISSGFNIAELVFQACHTGELTSENRKQLQSVLLQHSISEEERSAIDRLIYATRRGWLRIANQIPLNLGYDRSKQLAIAFLMVMNIRIGNGYDIHQLSPNRPLILGGVNIPHELGLVGHSDADVLTHAIMDALLGALSLGDIGHYFPPSDPQWKGADSLKLLYQVNGLLLDRGWQVVNIDSVIVAERPKLKPHLSAMGDRLSKVLNLQPDQISIKATTNEKLGPVGREEGIAAYAVTLLEKM